MNSNIGRIETVSLKAHFASESSGLTPWLADNIDVLSEAIHRKIINPETEQTSENFRVDIRAELEDDDAPVVIENQFGDSNHDHLGKIITYRTAFNAKVAIWIVERAKQEHIDTINWLNQTDNGCEFFLLELHLIRIGTSPLGPLFSVKSAPAKDSREKGDIRREETKRHELRLKFWTKFLEAVKQDKNMPAFRKTSATKDSFISSGTGIGGILWTLWITRNFMRCELRIDRGKGAADENLAILHKLSENRESVDKAFGPGLKWEEMEGYRATSIRTEFQGGYNDPEEEWDEIIAADIEKVKRFIMALKGVVAKLK